MSKSFENQEVAERFIDEKLAQHWQVDETQDSFKQLLNHIEKKTNFKPFFEEAIRNAFAELECRGKKDNLVVYDIGSGVSWTSAVMAKLPNVRKVYAIEPSRQRLKHAKYIQQHFQAPEGKLELQSGTFSSFFAPEKADLVVYCASFHHCYEDLLPGLFDKAKEILAPHGIILLANEHYVNWIFILQQCYAVLRGYRDWSALKRMPDSFGGEHWRTKSEIKQIFDKYGFKTNICLLNGDLCKDKDRLVSRMALKYYYALLRF